MSKIVQCFKLESKPVHEAQRVSRRQCEYAQDLAEKTESTIPTERQLLDYCNRATMNRIIAFMKAGVKVDLC